jgi:hypothetical protein
MKELHDEGEASRNMLGGGGERGRGEGRRREGRGSREGGRRKRLLSGCGGGRGGARRSGLVIFFLTGFSLLLLCVSLFLWCGLDSASLGGRRGGGGGGGSRGS